jgi:hypothetical protein
LRPILAGVRAIAIVTILDRHHVVELMAAESAGVAGARVVDRVSGSGRVLSADLVIDAMGRGARTPAFLEALGCGRPVEERLVVQLAYARPGTLTENFVLVGATSDRPTGGICCCGNDILLVTLAGMMGREPPLELPDLIALAAEFAAPAMLAVLRAAQPLDEVARYHYPFSQGRRSVSVHGRDRGSIVQGATR